MNYNLGNLDSHFGFPSYYISNKDKSRNNPSLGILDWKVTVRLIVPLSEKAWKGTSIRSR